MWIVAPARRPGLLGGDPGVLFEAVTAARASAPLLWDTRRGRMAGRRRPVPALDPVRGRRAPSAHARDIGRRRAVPATTAANVAPRQRRHRPAPPRAPAEKVGPCVHQCPRRRDPERLFMRSTAASTAPTTGAGHGPPSAGLPHGLRLPVVPTRPPRLGLRCAAREPTGPVSRTAIAHLQARDAGESWDPTRRGSPKAAPPHRVERRSERAWSAEYLLPGTWTGRGCGGLDGASDSWRSARSTVAVRTCRCESTPVG